MGEHQQRVVAGRYTLLRELGRGGMGVVWLAEDAAIGRRVAVKELLLPPGIPADERDVFEERVLREARTAGRLNDPGIVTVHDVQQEDGVTYIVMELVDAPDLADLVRRSGPLPTDEVLRIADGVLSALAAAHAAGVVHRDVKPSNVMVTPNGRIKLTDFGIAQSTEDPRLTTSGLLVGSPTYTSPERLLGQDASPASDLWSMGALLYFAAEGVGAYDRPITAASIQAIVNERAELHTVQPGRLADLITGLMDPDPATRLTAAQARALIDQAPADSTQVIRAPKVAKDGTRTLARPKRTRRGMAVAMAAVVLAGAVVAALAVTGVLNSGKRTADSGPPTSSSPAAGVPANKYANFPTMNTVVYGPDAGVSSKDIVDNPTPGCFVGWGDAMGTAKRVACAKPHHFEIYHTVELDTPGTEDDLAATTNSRCTAKLQDIRLVDMVIIGVMVPNQSAWNTHKRRGLCVVYMLPEPATGKYREMTGSVADN